MREAFTATKHFGFAPTALAARLAQAVAAGTYQPPDRAEGARRLGIGTIQLEALCAWMRLAGLTKPGAAGPQVSSLGRLIHGLDPGLASPCTWWALHWQLSQSYVVWRILARLDHGWHTVGELEDALRASAPDRAATTIRNARASLTKALADTPLGQELGLVRLESDGRRVTGLVKLRVRHGMVPMAAVAYALVDWSRREGMRSAAIETLAGADGPGAVLHLSEGELERYLIDIDSAFRGQVLTYSRTAGLDEAYFKREIAPLQVLAAHYIRARDGIEWREALERAKEEVRDYDDAE